MAERGEGSAAEMPPIVSAAVPSSPARNGLPAVDAPGEIDCGDGGDEESPEVISQAAMPSAELSQHAHVAAMPSESPMQLHMLRHRPHSPEMCAPRIVFEAPAASAACVPPVAPVTTRRDDEAAIARKAATQPYMLPHRPHASEMCSPRTVLEAPAAPAVRAAPAAPVTTRRNDMDVLREVLSWLLGAVFRRYNPANMTSMPTLLRKYRGGEVALLHTALSKHIMEDPDVGGQAEAYQELLRELHANFCRGS